MTREFRMGYIQSVQERCLRATKQGERTHPRVGSRQKSCRREACRKARKLLAQHRWTERNPGYFRGRYPYVKLSNIWSLAHYRPELPPKETQPLKGISSVEKQVLRAIANLRGIRVYVRPQKGAPFVEVKHG